MGANVLIVAYNQFGIGTGSPRGTPECKGQTRDTPHIFDCAQVTYHILFPTCPESHES